MDAADDDDEDNSLMASRPRRALEDVEDGKFLLETPLDLVSKPEIISQMVPPDNAHPWAPALLQTKMKTFEKQPTTMSKIIQPALLPLKDYFGPLGHLRGLRPKAPWGLVVPSSSFGSSGKRTGIFNYRFIRI